MKCEITDCDWEANWKFPFEGVVNKICDYHAKKMRAGISKIHGYGYKELVFEPIEVVLSAQEEANIELEPLTEKIIGFHDLSWPIHKVIEELEMHRRQAAESGYERVRVEIDGSIKITGIKLEDEEDLEKKHGVKFVPEQFD